MKSLRVGSLYSSHFIELLLSWRENIKAQIWPLVTLWRLSLRHYSFLAVGRGGDFSFSFLISLLTSICQATYTLLIPFSCLCSCSVTKAWPLQCQGKVIWWSLFCRYITFMGIMKNGLKKWNSNVWVSKEVPLGWKRCLVENKQLSHRGDWHSIWAWDLAPWIVK